MIVGGKMRTLNLTEHIRKACEELLIHILEAIKLIILRADSDSVSELLQNIILTGGGSQIRNISAELQELLKKEGFEEPRVHTMGKHYEEFVGQGALVAARQAREDQWQQLIA